MTVLHAFADGSDGAYPVTPPVVAGDGSLYGVTSAGFNGNYLGGGTVYHLTTGTLTTAHAFAEGGKFCEAALLPGADGNLYGTTSGGGAKEGGTVFAYNTDGVLLGLYNLDPDTEGLGPNAALIDGGDGSFYGTTAGGGPDGIGSIFQLTVTSHTSQTSARRARDDAGSAPRAGPGLSAIVDFVLFANHYSVPNTPDTVRGVTLYHSTTSKAAQADAVPSAPPILYGVFQTGASGGGGAVFSYPFGGTLSYLHEFGLTSDDGKLPYELVEGADGNFYGVTYGGGKAGVGTVFRCGIDGSYASLYPFKGTGDGAYPQAALAVGADDNLYGTTSANDVISGGQGTIFRIAPDGTFATVHTFAADGSEGSQPSTALLAATDGNLYGVTSGGGANFAGTLFSITPGGGFTLLYSFDPYHGAGGEIPQAALTQAADGTIYGATSAGGTDGAGILFKVVVNASVTPTPSTVTIVPAGNGEAIEGGAAGKAFVQRTGDTSTALTVFYKVVGSAHAGVEYKPLTGSVTIPVGASKARIKLKPLSDPGLAGTFVAKLKLKASTDGSYTLGSPAVTKIKVIDQD